MGIRLLSRKRSYPNSPTIKAGECAFKNKKATHFRIAFLLFSELACVDSIVDFLHSHCMNEKICAKPYMDLTVFINSRFRRNGIHDPLLQ